MEAKPEEANKTEGGLRGILSLKEYLIFAPAIGVALAMVFDVGYFYGLNSGFFSAFSLSEHILFAVYALPIAAFFLVGAAIEWAVLVRFDSRAAERMAGLSEAEAAKVRGKEIRKRRNISFGAFGMVALTLAYAVFL